MVSNLALSSWPMCRQRCLANAPVSSWHQKNGPKSTDVYSQIWWWYFWWLTHLQFHPCPTCCAVVLAESVLWPRPKNGLQYTTHQEGIAQVTRVIQVFLGTWFLNICDSYSNEFVWLTVKKCRASTWGWWRNERPWHVFSIHWYAITFKRKTVSHAFNHEKALFCEKSFESQMQHVGRAVPCHPTL